ncbi:hypothetical protein LTR08_006417 [Meristemomyces frigidus]|nr:hypothetical protein LTR08_006417 [Meristemomyces frigidus]
MAAPMEQQAKAGGHDTNGVNNTPGRANGGPDEGDKAEAGNKFQQAVAAWRTLGLTTLVSSLDVAASELVTHQKDSLVQRKDLAQKTKDFRKLEDAAKLAEIKDLLKAYQGYIDALTTQSKSVQAAFMQAYSPLSEAPDPYPLLEASIDSQVTADEVVPKLESENEHLQKQVVKLNAQLEESETQLEQERTKRQSFEASQDSRIKEVEASWSAVLKEKEENWSAKETSLEDKVENQDRLLKELKASYEVTQRLERSGEDAQDLGRGTATQAELDIVSSELERANIRLADVESRNEQLRVELAQSAGQAHSSARSAAVEDDPVFLRLRSENQALLRKLESTRYDKDSERSTVESRLRGLERETSTLRADRDALQGKVHKWSDYDEVKRELDMLRAIEFATADDDDDDDDVGDDSASVHATGTLAAKPKPDSLEHLLLTRNSKLGNELTQLRVAHHELLQRLETLQAALASTTVELEQARALTATLEDDLQRTQQEASSALETMSVPGTLASRNAKPHYFSRRAAAAGGSSPTSSILEGLDPTSPSGSASPRALDTLQPVVGASSGILPMVTAQRDRFKKKIAELEAELQRQYQVLAGLRSEVAALQRDNLGLYEKTRYVSTYSRNYNNSNNNNNNNSDNPPSASGANPYYHPPTSTPNPPSQTVGDGGEARYRTAYEHSLSPFAAFRGRESARALRRMTLPERAVFQVTRMVLATRGSRALFAGYLLGLHFLVLGMLGWMGGGCEGGSGGGGWRAEGLGGGGGGLG